MPDDIVPAEKGTAQPQAIDSTASPSPNSQPTSTPVTSSPTPPIQAPLPNLVRSSTTTWKRASRTLRPPPPEYANNRAYAVLIKPGFHEGLLYNHEGRFQVEHTLEGDKPARFTAEHNSAPGVYHHVVVTISAANGAGCIYVDGALDGSWKWTPGPARKFGQETWNIGIGRPKAANCAWPFKGIIDEVRLYDRVLRAGEVSILSGLQPKK